MTKKEFTTIPGYPATEITKDNNPSNNIRPNGHLMVRSNKGRIFVLDEPDTIYIGNWGMLCQGPATLDELKNALND